LRPDPTNLFIKLFNHCLSNNSKDAVYGTGIFMLINMFVDSYAMFVITLLAGVSVLIFRREAMSAEGINKITEFSIDPD